MKNLQVIGCKPHVIPHCKNALMSINVDNGLVYFVSSLQFIEYNPISLKINFAFPLDELISDDDNTDVVFAVQHVSCLDAVVLATTNGNVHLYDTTTHQFECVGTVDSGLTCMAWSPDEEIVAFTTGEDLLMLMNKNFDPICESLINSEISDKGGPVNVGWGSKKTQFHGSMGKDAARMKDNVEDTAVFVSEDDDRKPRISWRGDGQYFVVSSLMERGNRELRVWSREGEVISSSENVTGQGMALNWRPSGNLIASVQNFRNKQQVIFFEKNGLRHGEFHLPSHQAKIVRLLWNIDSSLLCLWSKMAKDDVDHDYETLQLWYSSNYHWFLKQELRFTNDFISDVVWDGENALQLHLITKTGTYTSYQFSWEIFVSRGCHVNNDSTVAMVDGAKLLLTEMSLVIIPPPMSSHCVEMDSPINMVTFHPDSRRLALILSNGYLVIVNKNILDSGSSHFNVVRVDVDKLCVNHLCQLTWWKEDTLLVYDSCREVIHEIILHEANGKYTAIYQIFFPVKNLLRLSVNVDTSSVALELTDGSIMKYTSDSEHVKLEPWFDADGNAVSLLQPCEHIAVVKIGKEEVVIGLTRHGRLYVNNKEIANNCSSFFVHDEFLLVTTTSHLLRCFSILSDGKGIVSILTNTDVREHVRNVERGSKIILAVPRDTKLILQMPRGNLETIHPRPLVISYLKKCLNSQEYNKAFLCMRKHRVNVNLLCDHDYKSFLKNVPVFVKEVESVAYINMFLSELNEVDVTTTLYSDYYFDRAQIIENKVDTICDMMRETLKDIDSNKYILSILTSYVKNTSPQLESALKIIKDLKDSKQISNADEALKYLLFLVPVDKMFNVALGMYDFQLVLMVAEKSQKDPKEYLPFLNNLRKLEENYQKFSIDKYLKRYSNALQHIAKCGSERFSEGLELIKEHNLYKEALRLFSGSEYKTIAVSYGEYLMDRKKYEEAGVVLFRCGDYGNALRAFQKAGNWRQVFSLATGKLRSSREELLSLARSMAGYLKENNRLDEAAVVLIDYADDHESAIECLIEGRYWNEALRQIYKYDRVDIIETDVQPALQQVQETMLSSLLAKKDDFQKYLTRLNIVRTEKEKRQMDLINDNDLDDDANAELFSDSSSISAISTMTSSSVSSRTSRSTGKSRKNRRKSQRNRVSLKKGSQYEDIALMEALVETISFVDKMKDEVSTLLRMLMMFHYENEASQLQIMLSEFLDIIHSSIPTIWSSNSSQEMATMEFGPQSTTNAIVNGMRNTETKEKDVPAQPAKPVLLKSHSWRLDQLTAW
ncbi:putative elongator complex protein 1 [Xenia sp. Carnegie-2017]|uniref:putative elongator complex protein 1 n=1 Tax=Xenia sp. Carnegie-2017 TaxID=2897299 RepID=UPI001F038829|nr:putative elongator complex protein 1 [Xenia sp. Carnegie-2017]